MRASHLLLLGASLVPAIATALPPLEKQRNSPGNLVALSPEYLAHRAPAVATYELPASFALSTKADIDACATIDANGDGKTWTFDAYAGGGGAACYEGIGTTLAPDDYLIVGAVNFNAPSGEYSLSVETKKLVKAESFEICLSPTGEASDAISVFSCADVPGSWTVLDGDFSIAAGKYYVMVHANSAAPGLSLYVRNLNISAAAAVNFTIPFTMVPEAGEAKYFSFIDANKDGKTWKYDTSNTGLAYDYSKDNDADDYALFPEIEFPEPGNYKFAFDARGWGTSLEALEVLVGQGDDPALFSRIFVDKAVGSTIYRREVVFTIDEPGKYRLALHCISPANRYKLLCNNFSVTATTDAPARHLPVEFSDAVSLNGGKSYTPAVIVPDNCRLKITATFRGDALTVTAGNAAVDAAQKSLTTFDASAETATVSRNVNIVDGGIFYFGLASEGNVNVTSLALQLVSEGNVYTIPFSMQPTAEEFNEFTVVNANNDDGVWSYYEQFGAVRYNFSVANDADDWLIFPAINVTSTAEMLRFAVNVRGMGDSPKFTETFEVWEGETADVNAMRKIFDSGDIRNEAFTPVEFSFAPTHTGVTFLAVHATSKANAFHLFLRDFKVEYDGRPTTVPAPVTGLRATAGPKGSEDATISFTMPLADEGGNPFEADARLTAVVATADDSMTLTGKPGQSMALNLHNGQGYGVVTVTVSNAAGVSNPATVRVYTGQDIPSPVTDMTVSCSADNRTMTVSWTQPTEGANGGYADPSKVSYIIRHSQGGGSYTTIDRVEGECRYVYTIPDSYPLAMHYIAVVPTNVAGQCTTPVGKGVMLGKPYEIPSSEDFAGGEMHLQPLAMDKPGELYTLDWYFENPADAIPEAANASGRALIAFTENEGAARGCLHLPKFTTVSESGARLVLRLYNYPHFGTTRVSAVTAEGVTEIATITAADKAGWVTYSLPLPAELCGLQWIEPVLDFGFDGTYDDEIWMLDAYGMEHYFDHELTLTADAVHSAMTAQKEYTWEFTVANYGRNAETVEVPTLSFTNADGDVVSFEEATVAGREITLNSTETAKLVYKVTLDAGMEGELAYDITTLLDGDGDLDNNTVFGSTLLKVQEEYVVRTLEAQRVGDTDEVRLLWTAPVVDNGLFTCENLDSWDYSASLGLFTNVDVDGERTIGFNIASFPGMNAVKGWQVWDYEEAGFGEIYIGHGLSKKTLIAFSPFDPNKTADDWLISPEVQGGTKVEFFVRPLSYAYGREKIEILASSTGNDIADFTLVSTFETAELEANLTPYWETVRVDLPADARYFAIRYVSHDIFGLQLDDISYVPAQADASELTYSVLRNGQVVATGVNDVEYTDRTDAPATYYVAAEKKFGGLHPLSNRAEVATSASLETVVAAGARVVATDGAIVVGLPASAAVTVTAVDGRVWYTGTLPAGDTTIALPAGLYVVALPSDTIKLLVP